jgi:cysteine desulfuration protein SufE
MSMHDAVQALVDELALFDDVMDKYQYIIEKGKSLKPLEPEYKQELYRVQGCQSRVWLYPYSEDERIHFKADGDALIVRGLVTLLLEIYSNRTAHEILDFDSAELKALHLSEVISSERQNSIASILKRMYGYAKEYAGGISF